MTRIGDQCCPGWVDPSRIIGIIGTMTTTTRRGGLGHQEQQEEAGLPMARELHLAQGRGKRLSSLHTVVCWSDIVSSHADKTRVQLLFLSKLSSEGG